MRKATVAHSLVLVLVFSQGCLRSPFDGPLAEDVTRGRGVRSVAGAMEALPKALRNAWMWPFPCTVFQDRPVPPVPALLQKLRPQLSALIERYHPGVRVDLICSLQGWMLRFRHDMRTPYTVPAYWKTGEVRELIQVRGPRPCEEGKPGHGISGTFSVRPGLWRGQALRHEGALMGNSSRDEPYNSAWGYFPSPDRTEYLDVGLTYPTCTDRQFLLEFQQLLRDPWRDAVPGAKEASLS